MFPNPRSIIIAVFVALVSALCLVSRVPIKRFNLTSPSTEEGQPAEYFEEPLGIPALRGLSVKMMYIAMKIPLVKDIVANFLMKEAGRVKLRSFAASVPEPAPLFYPYTVPTAEEMKSLGAPDNASAADLKELLDPGKSKSVILKLHHRFLKKELTPTALLQKVLDAIKQSNDKLHAFVDVDAKGAAEEAARSTKRYSEGKPLSLVDGIPTALKACFASKGLHYTHGLAHLQNRVAETDDILVKKLKDAGAVIVGVTNMVEYGAGVTGENWIYGHCRNPHNLKHDVGGSSGGAGAAVAAGFVPLAFGQDGGGSIRIPSSLNGIVGLKTTHGRVPYEFEDAPTVAVSGPMALTADDVMIAYQIVAYDGKGNLPEYLRYPQPLPLFDKTILKSDLSGIRIGIFESWNARSSPEVHKAITAVRDSLVARGAKVVPIVIPYLDVVLPAHVATILSEMGTTLFDRVDKVNLSWTIGVTMELSKFAMHADYLAAAIARRWFFEKMRYIFSKCDVMLTPATGMTAPEITEAAVTNIGQQDFYSTVEIMRFSRLGNLVGTPAIVVPVGKDAKGLPISAQFMATHWNEAILLRLARIVEARARPAEVYHGEILTD